MRYTLKQLQYFVAASEAGSVKQAGDVLNISQPSISAAIAHLEGVFGVQLFIRHHAKGISMTPAGRRLLGRSKQLLIQARSLHQYAFELGSALSGSLEVGCFTTLAPIVMPTLIREFQSRYPDLSVHCRESDVGQLHKALLEGDHEIALTYDLVVPEDTTFHGLRVLPPYAILPPDHRLAGGVSVSLKDLADEPFVLLDLPHSRDYFLRLFAEQDLSPRIAHSSSSPNMVRGLVANGLGYSLMNASLGTDRTLDGKRFVALGLSEDCEPMRIGVAHLRGIALTRAAETFVAFCRERIPGLAV